MKRVRVLISNEELFIPSIRAVEGDPGFEQLSHERGGEVLLLPEALVAAYQEWEFRGMRLVAAMNRAQRHPRAVPK